ncbi:hypothetical protein [Streptomyces sp. SAS_267]|uniref:hypothetical protein n=1 Tax=Streptomyces sp. SAS_267 TaxID=3412750 RepID=UPI00403CEE3B
MHALRHFYASVLLDAGENNKALAEHLGHSDPGLTLRVYAHLMPSSQEHICKAVATVFGQRSTVMSAAQRPEIRLSSSHREQYGADVP